MLIKPLDPAMPAQYASAQPFPHIVLEDFFPADVLDKVLEEIPDRSIWDGYNHVNSKKLAMSDVMQMGKTTRDLIYYLNSSAFIFFVEKLTGISGLIPDPHLQGGGYHRLERGGFLKIHADFNRHKILNLDRRVNLLLYLNKDWPESYGGHLELWDRTMSHCHHRILPVFNRMVVFNTTDFSYHGNPEPVACPEDRSRYSIAMYYYSSGRPESERSATHNTLYQVRPDTDDPGMVRREKEKKKQARASLTRRILRKLTLR